MEKPLPNSRTKPRALVVDDNDSCLKMMVAALERMGVDAATAGDCRSCSERLKESDYDLIFMDLHLPDSSGIEITEQNLKSSDVPVVAYTADSSEKTWEEARSAGMTRRLLKPVFLTDLRNVLSDLLHQRNVDSEPQVNGV